MRAVDIIIKKRRGMALTDQEIDFFIEGYSQGSIPDYQVSALLMAIYFQGMSDQERAALTMAMVRSGQEIDLSSIQGIKVDKHSTGGVGDTTTLVLAPLVAALGAPVAKMSGRGLGHTGGTIDKFEAIPGFKLELGQEQFIHNVNNIGVAVVAQTGNLTPADKKLYALRDVTGTVESIPLIASSIMSKKIAAGANAIVLDVKTGNGAFMKEEKDAFTLAQAMVDIGELVGRKTVALITDMSQPLGKAIGNSIEVKEAIDTLKGQGPKDLEDLCLNLGAQLLILADKAENEAEAKSKLKDAISSGKAINKLKELIGAQGGDPRVVDNPDLLPQADKIIEVKASSSGYVNSIDSELLGNGAMTLGAGRETKESIIDLAVGISVEKKLGDYVAVGDTLALLHVNDERNLTKVQQMVLSAYSLGVERNEPPKLIYGVVTKEGGF